MRFHYRRAQRRSNCLKVILAVYWLSEGDGAVARMNYRTLGEAAGLTAETVRGFLRDLDASGIVAAYPCSAKSWPVVIMDHPDAAAEIARIERGGLVRMRDFPEVPDVEEEYAA